MATLATLLVKLVGDISGFSESMGKAEDVASKAGGSLASKLGGGLATVGKAAGGIALAGIAAAGTAMVGSVGAANDWAGKLDSLQDVLGTTADDSAALMVAIRGVGGDTDAITGQFAKLTTGIFDAKGGLSTSGVAMEKLGIAFRDSNGQLLPTTDLIKNIADRLALMPDGLEKTDAMMTLFGKSGKDMGDTMNALANGGLEAARVKAQALGLTIGQDGVEKSLAMGRAMEDLQMVGQGLAVSLGSQLLPAIVPLIQKFAEWAISVMPEVRRIVEKVGEVIGQLVEGITRGTGPFGEFGTTVRQIFETIGRVAGEVIGWLREHWPEISATVSAVFAAIKGFVETVLVPVIAFVIETVGKVVTWVRENWPLIQSTFEKVFNAIKTVVETVAPILEQVIGGTFNSIKAIVETVINVVLGIIKTVMQVINGDWEGAWASVKQVVVDIWNGIQNFFGGLPAQVLQFGVNIINGLIQGIQNSASGVLNALRGIVDGAINTIKYSLGIRSPSTVFAGIGGQMMAGLAKGISDASGLPEVQLNASASGWARAANNGSDRAVAASNKSYTLNVNNAGAPANLLGDFALLQALGG